MNWALGVIQIWNMALWKLTSGNRKRTIHRVASAMGADGVLHFQIGERSDDGAAFEWVFRAPLEDRGFGVFNARVRSKNDVVIFKFIQSHRVTTSSSNRSVFPTSQ